MRPVVIGVAGGTGSGKTTVVTKIMDSLGDDAVGVDILLTKVRSITSSTE